MRKEQPEQPVVVLGRIPAHQLRQAIPATQTFTDDGNSGGAKVGVRDGRYETVEPRKVSRTYGPRPPQRV